MTEPQMVNPDDDRAPLLAAFGFADVAALVGAGPAERAALGVFDRTGDLAAALSAASDVRRLMARGGVFYADGC